MFSRLVLGSTKRLEQNTGSDATVGALGGESSDTSGLFYSFDLQAKYYKTKANSINGKNLGIQDQNARGQLVH